MAYYEQEFYHASESSWGAVHRAAFETIVFFINLCDDVFACLNLHDGERVHGGVVLPPLLACLHIRRNN